MKKRILFMAAFMLFMSLANAQWQQTFSTNKSLYCLGINGNYIFSGTDSGRVYVSNNGINWDSVSTGTGYNISSFAIAGSKVYASVAGDGGVYYSSDNGASWIAVNISGFGIFSLAISGIDIFIGSIAGVFLSTDNGATWLARNTGLTSVDVRTLVISGSDMFSGTQGGGVFYSSNNGVNWSHASTGLINSLVNTLVVDGGTIYAGTQGGVCYSTNNGTNWTAITNTGLPNINVRALAINGSEVFAGTWSGIFVNTTNSGSSWYNSSAGLTDTVVYALAIDGPELLAGTYGGIWERPLSQMTGIKNIAEDYVVIKVFPNPADKYISIVNPGFTDGKTNDIRIYDISGQKVMQFCVMQYQAQIDIGNLPDGVYMIKSFSNGKTRISKFLKE